ncbi:unnamed protein product [Musa acuminata var. zebrina]
MHFRVQEFINPWWLSNSRVSFSSAGGRAAEEQTHIDLLRVGIGPKMRHLHLLRWVCWCLGAHRWSRWVRREPAAELGDPDLDPEDVQPSVPLKKPAPSDLAATTPLSTSRLPTAGA